MSAPEPIRVLIVDDHAVVRDGIVMLLERQADMTVAGEASDGAEAIAKFEELAPHVTLMDMQMPGTSGLEAIIAIRRQSPGAKILVLTTYPCDAQAMRAMRAGAAGYLLKNCIRKDLLEAIRSVYAGRHAISAEVAHEVAIHALDEGLTERELAVLRLVAEGCPNKDIGRRLDLSTDTIKAHLKSIFAKLAVDDRTHAVTVATRRGFLER